MERIKIETGLKTYDIEDENGNIRGQISFNPSDVNFFKRSQITKEKINELLVRAGEIKHDLDQEELTRQLDQIDNEIKEQVNKLFDDENASRVVFGNQNCLNTLCGVSFVERFLIAFVPVIQKAFNEETQKSKERISKYTEQVSE